MLCLSAAAVLAPSMLCLSAAAVLAPLGCARRRCACAAAALLAPPLLCSRRRCVLAPPAPLCLRRPRRCACAARAAVLAPPATVLAPRSAVMLVLVEWEPRLDGAHVHERFVVFVMPGVVKHCKLAPFQLGRHHEWHSPILFQRGIPPAHSHLDRENLRCSTQECEQSKRKAGAGQRGLRCEGSGG
jgi:hypothetical protein